MKFQDLLDGKLSHLFEFETGITYEEDGFVQWYPIGGPNASVVVVDGKNEFELSSVQHAKGRDTYQFTVDVNAADCISFALTDEVLVKRYRKVLDVVV